VTETIAPDSGTPLSKGLLARFIGVLTSPKQTYADIARRPAWLGMFVLLVVIGGGCGGWLSSTTVGRRAAVDEASRMMDSLGIRVPEARYNEIRDRILNAPDWRMYLQAFLGALFIYGIGTAVIAGILLGIFNALLGGAATFKQVFAVALFSQAVLATKTLFVTPLNYVRESLSNPTSFAALAPMLDDTSLPAKILGSIDFFWLWWIVSLSIGLGVLYKRPTRGIAISLISVYVVLAVTIAVVIALIRG
jgi:hypothetical protein